MSDDKPKPDSSEPQKKPYPELRTESRYPCVGITLLYSPAQETSVSNLAELIFEAAVHDMSLSGLAFEVEKEMQKGERLLVLMRQPECDASARVMSEVCWCRKLSSGHYRVGITIDRDEPVVLDAPGIHISDPIGKTTVPHALYALCPACNETATFSYAGEQPVLAGLGIMPLYNCSGCGTTRSLTGIFFRQIDPSKPQK